MRVAATLLLANLATVLSTDSAEGRPGRPIPAVAAAPRIDRGGASERLVFARAAGVVTRQHALEPLSRGNPMVPRITSGQASGIGALNGAIAGGVFAFKLCQRDDCTTPAPVAIIAVKGAVLGAPDGTIIGSGPKSVIVRVARLRWWRGAGAEWLPPFCVGGRGDDLLELRVAVTRPHPVSFVQNARA